MHFLNRIVLNRWVNIVCSEYVVPETPNAKFPQTMVRKDNCTPVTNELRVAYDLYSYSFSVLSGDSVPVGQGCAEHLMQWCKLLYSSNPIVPIATGRSLSLVEWFFARCHPYVQERKPNMDWSLIHFLWTKLFSKIEEAKQLEYFFALRTRVMQKKAFAWHPNGTWGYLKQCPYTMDWDGLRLCIECEYERLPLLIAEGSNITAVHAAKWCLRHEYIKIGTTQPSY